MLNVLDTFSYHHTMARKSPGIIVGADPAQNHKAGMDSELPNNENVEKRKSDIDRSIDFGSDLVINTDIGSEDEREIGEMLQSHQEALRQRKMFPSTFSQDRFARSQPNQNGLVKVTKTMEVQPGNDSYTQVTAQTKVQKVFQMFFAPRIETGAAQRDCRSHPRTTMVKVKEDNVLQADIFKKLRRDGFSPVCIQKSI